MLKRLLFTLLWTGLFAVASLALLLCGFIIAGIYFNPIEDSASITFSQLWKFTPLIGAAVGFTLGLLGRLPGTHEQRTR
jgi:hypothetical protein